MNGLSRATRPGENAPTSGAQARTAVCIAGAATLPIPYGCRLVAPNATQHEPLLCIQSSPNHAAPARVFAVRLQNLVAAIAPGASSKHIRVYDPNDVIAAHTAYVLYEDDAHAPPIYVDEPASFCIAAALARSRPTDYGARIVPIAAA